MSIISQNLKKKSCNCSSIFNNKFPLQTLISMRTGIWSVPKTRLDIFGAQWIFVKFPNKFSKRQRSENIFHILKNWFQDSQDQISINNHYASFAQDPKIHIAIY